VCTNKSTEAVELACVHLCAEKMLWSMKFGGFDGLKKTNLIILSELTS
jgi:hypothetical protein